MESLKDIFVSQIKGLRPSFLAKKPHFNFISVHYFWIIGLTILGSVLIYGPGKGNIAYIDALAFAAGGATQAGLNTVDVSSLNLFQQIIIFILAALANPMTINSAVVLLRLYWFEKRFQHIAREARMRRGTISKSKGRPTNDVSQVERGVNGRNITVVRNGASSRMANDGTYLGPSVAPESDTAGVATTRTATAADSDLGDANMSQIEPTESRKPEIKFAPTVKRSDGIDDHPIKFPPQLSDAEHIAILERQRAADDEVLRIPGPRDAERGILPERVVRALDEEGAETRSAHARQFSDVSYNSTETISPPDRADPDNSHSGRTSRASRISRERQAAANARYGNGHARSGPGGGDESDSDEGPDGRGRQRLRQAITIQEPEKPSSHREELSEDAIAAVRAFSIFHRRRPHFSDPHKKETKEAKEAREAREAKEANHHSDPETREDEPRLPRTFTSRSRRLTTLRRAFTSDREVEPAPYLSWEPTLGRNSAFPNLTEDQREELGGIEYRSLKTLALVLFFYFWGFSVLGIVCLLPWIMRSQKFGAVVEAAHQERVWWGFFTPHSAFMDLGFTLTPDSMNSFNTAVFPLLLLSFLIVIGNTGFPVMLRFVIWVLSLFVPLGSGLFEELKFLLDHPRRCFTLLFPSGATWWLFWLLVALNGIDLLFFCVLDLGNGPIFDLPAGIKVLDGLFQAFSTRTAGFSCVNLSDLHPAVQASYMIMMYISVFPIAISVRRTNVYEEKSLGIYGSGTDVDEPTNGTDLEYVGAHLRRQLSFDLWFLSIGFFILTISEGGPLQRGDFSMFAVLFEVVSAYGTVGLSLGYTGVNASLCSQFSVIGKLVIIGMMIRGRHRGLPYGLDRAILLPSESLNAKEAADADARGPLVGPSTTMRRNSIGSQGTGAGTGAGFDTSAPPMLRVATTMRDRQYSRSIDRVNSNIITSFLHVGPPVVHGHPTFPAGPRHSLSEPALVESNSGQSTGTDAAVSLDGRRDMEYGRG